jgi:hypothetical protein
MENIIKEIKESFRNGKIDNRIGFIRGNFETFEEWMIDYFQLEKYYNWDEDDCLDEDEFNNNIKKLNTVIFEECVKRLKIELQL